MVMPNIGEVLPQVGRRWRRPKHTFVLRNMPYQIQPFLIAPVLPGETMKQLLIQSRAVTQPLVNALIGWWLEYYVFYVKHRDLDARDLLVNMMLDPNTDVSSLRSAAKASTYHFANGIDWAQKCLERVVECYFRDEDEAWNTNLLGTLPTAHALNANENWMDTLVVDAVMPDYDPSDTSQQALSAQQNMYQYLTAMKLTDMTYEQWLATYGVHVDQPGEAHKPELVRYVREWTYPSNTVDPLTGTPTSAASWSIAERADKDRFFREPGFLFGVTVLRPKVYYSAQSGSAVDLLDSALRWLPAIMKDDPATSLAQIATATGPAPGITDVGGYWLDLKDIFLYGDQFFNDTNIAANFVALPSTTGAKRYPTQAAIDAMFKTAAKNYIEQDGVVSLAILGAQQDTT